MKIAVIGGVGSGKSEVVRVAREMGIECISADEINNQLLCDTEYIKKIEVHFPNAVKNGVVDKKTLGSEIFGDKRKRALLNSIAHPEIMKRITKNDQKNLIVELPLIFESGAKEMFDEILLVDAPMLKRLKRLKNRGMSYRRAVCIMQTQVGISELKKIATITIDNRGSKADLEKAAGKVFASLQLDAENKEI